jgi:transposase
MHIKGQNRHQGTLFPERLDELIGADNPVRVIDAFVDLLDLKALGFGKAHCEETGRPPYDPADLLKLYLYGYLQRVRSSRPLARECQRNVEVLWLLNRLAPKFKTIADFRSLNGKALGRVCREFVLFCRSQALYGGELVAIDGSKFKADNHPGKVSRKQVLKQEIERIDREIEVWLDGMAETDAADEEPEPVDAERTRRALEALQGERERLTERVAGMEARGLEAQADTDPDARPMRGCGVGYNVQMSVDDKHALIVDHDVVTDGNDVKQLYRMARRSRSALQAGVLKVLADKGYSNGHLLARCQSHGIEPYVPVQRAVNNQGEYFDKSEPFRPKDLPRWRGQTTYFARTPTSHPRRTSSTLAGLSLLPGPLFSLLAHCRAAAGAANGVRYKWPELRSKTAWTISRIYLKWCWSRPSAPGGSPMAPNLSSTWRTTSPP